MAFTRTVIPPVQTAVAKQRIAVAHLNSSSSEVVTKLQALVERDKAELAREIHDELGGYLIAASMDVTVLKQRFASLDEDSQQRFIRVSSMLNAAVDMMRRVTEELRPTLLDNVGLFAALRWQMKHMCSRSKVICTEHFPEAEPRLSAAASIALFRIGQDALVVAEDQEAVTAVDLSITVDPDCLSIRVSSDGKTAEPAQDSRGSVALAFVRHRLHAMGGAVTIERPASGGMNLTAQVDMARLDSQ
jgi:signal transduction histidine kinase